MFDVKGTGGILETICEVLPFYHGVTTARMACAMDFGGDFIVHLLVTVGYAAVILIASVLVFKNKMRADLK